MESTSIGWEEYPPEPVKGSADPPVNLDACPGTYAPLPVNGSDAMLRGVGTCAGQLNKDLGYY